MPDIDVQERSDTALIGSLRWPGEVVGLRRASARPTFPTRAQCRLQRLPAGGDRADAARHGRLVAGGVDQRPPPADAPRLARPGLRPARLTRAAPSSPCGWPSASPA